MHSYLWDCLTTEQGAERATAKFRGIYEQGRPHPRNSTLRYLGNATRESPWQNRVTPPPAEHSCPKSIPDLEGRDGRNSYVLARQNREEEVIKENEVSQIVQRDEEQHSLLNAHILCHFARPVQLPPDKDVIALFITKGSYVGVLGLLGKERKTGGWTLKQMYSFSLWCSTEQKGRG